MTSNWSILGYFMASVLILVGSARYLIVFNDWFRGLSCILFGILIIAVSFLYNRQIKQSNTILHIEDYIEDKINKQEGK